MLSKRELLFFLSQKKKKKEPRARAEKKERKKRRTVAERPRAREEKVSVAVERHRHHPVRQIKSFLDAVAVVDVDVDVEDAEVKGREVGFEKVEILKKKRENGEQKKKRKTSMTEKKKNSSKTLRRKQKKLLLLLHSPRVVLEQLQDGQHQVVDVAEAGGLGLFRVVQPPGPVDRDVAQPVVEPDRALDRGGRVGPAKVPEPREGRAVLVEVEAGQGRLGRLARRGLGRDLRQEVDVVARVELGDFCLLGPARGEDVEPCLVEAVAQHEVVGHDDAVGLHGVVGAVVHLAPVALKKVFFFPERSFRG